MSIDHEEQFLKMRDIGAIVANCLEFIKAKARVGMSTQELDAMAGKFLEQHGAISAPKATYNFPGNICISVEREAAHGIPSQRLLQEGDLINIDVSAAKDGFFADNGESFIVGKGSSEKKKLCHHIKKALHLALNTARANTPINGMGKKVEEYARRHQLTVIKNLGGHGVGLSLHEEPEFIASYYNRQDRRIFQENMVVAIEPFLSNGASYIHEADDGWTLFHPHYYTVQKEHTLMIRKGRPFIFTTPTKTYDSV